MARFVYLQLFLMVGSILFTMLTINKNPVEPLKGITVLIVGMLMGSSICKLICFFGVDGK